MKSIKKYKIEKVSLGVASCLLAGFNINPNAGKSMEMHEIQKIRESPWKAKIRAKVTIEAAGRAFGSFTSMTQILHNP